MLRKNITANAFAQVWTTLIGIIFIPQYITFLGTEAYGMIAFFALLYTWLSLLNMGFAPTVNREMARLTGRDDDVANIYDLLRSIEFIVFGIALICVVLVFAASFWLAGSWLNADELSEGEVQTAIQLIGVYIGLRFFEDIYRSALVGLQKQVYYSTLNCLLATIRSVGVLAILAFVSPTIKAFFIWQIFISVIAVLVYCISTYHFLPAFKNAAKFSLKEISRVKRFATGMLGITLLATLLTQFDKIILTKILSLADYGFYALASVVAGLVVVVSQPVSQAIFPRLSELYERNSNQEIIGLFHMGSQVISVILGCVAGTLIVYTDYILGLWIDDSSLVMEITVLVKILVIGNLANGLMAMPYHVQLAHGWTRLSFYVNLFSLALLVPLILWLVPDYGAVAAALIWVLLNLGYVFITPYFMHKRILPDEKWRWYFEDLCIPICTAFITALLLKYFIFAISGEVLRFVVFLISVVLVFAASVASAPLVRKYVFQFLKPADISGQ